MQITTPTILTVYNSRGKVVSSTVVDYGQTDAAHDALRELCQKNQWYYQITVPAVWDLFINDLRKKAEQ